MQTKGYTIYDSAAFTHNGYLYSAYIFLSPDPAPPASRDTLDKETWILAFYLWDGSENHLLGTTYGKTLNNDSESGTYPYHLQFVDWETPFLGWEFTFMLDPESPDQDIWKLQGFSSDINRNGYPEFAVAGSYGLRSQPYPAFSFYEVNGSSVIDLAAGLPGDIHWGPYDKDASVFIIEKHFITGLHAEILIQYYYRWDGSKFVNVSRGFANQRLPRLEKDQAEIEAYFGGPLETAPFFIDGQYGSIAEYVYEILLNYEAIQMPSRGMTFFLEATDPNNWPGSSDENLCYLQYIRAYTQAEYADGEMFSLPSPSNNQFSLLSFTESLPFMLETVDTEIYDLSICEALLGTE